jgi:hypothetical protein
MMLWQATPANLWQGRDDSAEAPNALRLFQTIPAPNASRRRRCPAISRCSASPVTKAFGATRAYRSG